MLLISSNLVLKISNKIKTTRELVDTLLIEHFLLTIPFPDICTAFIKYLTL